MKYHSFLVLLKRTSFSIIISSCLLLLTISGCKNYTNTPEASIGREIPINDSISSDTAIEAYIRPYRTHLNKVLDSTLAYNPKILSKNEKGLNTGIGNFMADLVMQQANTVFQKQTGHTIDAVLLNYGGIRAELPKGNITSRNAFELMPFENEIVIVALKGTAMQEMMTYLQKGHTAHPISGMQLLLDKKGMLHKATVQGKPINSNKTYYVATSDYLQQGGDHMDFFKDPVQLYTINYKLRNAIIDYLKKVDTIHAKQDNRFTNL
ncbi:5'-nucleotidase C-terminal domain-containing protein [Zhouia sp. PK063]|uniref:5'-nucleotidase C-terminal domain-containing protein n=1 Tax=Zhouia sp. PK063 TaxID=3373602 RepID=UPI0037B8090F